MAAINLKDDYTYKAVAYDERHIKSVPLFWTKEEDSPNMLAGERWRLIEKTIVEYFRREYVFEKLAFSMRLIGDDDNDYEFYLDCHYELLVSTFSDYRGERKDYIIEISLGSNNADIFFCKNKVPDAILDRFHRHLSVRSFNVFSVVYPKVTIYSLYRNTGSPSKFPAVLVCNSPLLLGLRAGNHHLLASWNEESCEIIGSEASSFAFTQVAEGEPFKGHSF
jgi:hypothetical protein